MWERAGSKSTEATEPKVSSTKHPRRNNARKCWRNPNTAKPRTGYIGREH